MVKIDHPGVNTVRKRRGDGSIRIYYYHRATGLRLPDDPASPEFAQRLRDLAPTPAPAGPGPGSVAALIEAYRTSPEFLGLADKTRRDYVRYLDIIKANWQSNRVRDISREAVLNLRDAYSDTPRTANYVVSVLRLLLTYAVDRPSIYGLTVNPATKPKRLKTGGGHRPWEESEIQAFRAHWRLGTLERTVFEVLLNTGQRGEDVAKMMRSHVAGGRVAVAQEKTDARVDVPISADLTEALTAWDDARARVISELEATGKAVPIAMRRQLLTTTTGRPVVIGYLGHLMIDAMQAVPDLAQGLASGGVTTHGLRFTAATRLRELDLDWESIADITGHQTAEMVRLYTRRRRRAEVSIAKLNRAVRGAKNDP